MRQRVVEAGTVAVADVRLDGRRVYSLLDEALVAALELLEVGDPCDLEPDEIDGVVDDALRVRLAEADLEVGGEPESLHGGGTYRLRLVSKRSTTEEDTMRRILTVCPLALAALALSSLQRGGDDDEAGGGAGDAEAEALEAGGRWGRRPRRRRGRRLPSRADRQSCASAARPAGGADRLARSLGPA